MSYFVKDDSSLLHTVVDVRCSYPPITLEWRSGSVQGEGVVGGGGLGSVMVVIVVIVVVIVGGGEDGVWGSGLGVGRGGGNVRHPLPFIREGRIWLMTTRLMGEGRSGGC